MLLTIHDMNLNQVASIDNDKQGTLNYFNDLWTRYLDTGSSTFDFTVFKKAIKSDTGSKKAHNYLNEKAFVSFEYEGETQLFTVRKTVEDEKLIKVNCVNLNLELINEYANPYKAPKAMSFKEYCQAMNLLNFTMLTIGLNEISDKKITTEWEGSDTKLARLLSLATKFGAELEFKTFLNDDSTIKQFVVNVYQGADADHQGMGKKHSKPLRYGKDFTTLTRTIDKTEIYNMVRPTGRTDDGKTVTIAKLSAWSVKNEDGDLEFYQKGESLYAPISAQMYPAAFTVDTMDDQWIRKDMTVESSSPEVIRATAYRELKKNCYPAVTYEVEGFAELGIGDTVQVFDDGFSPTLLLEMRVSEQTISFTNKSNNKTVFSNFKALENKLSQGIQARLDQMLEDAKPYTIKVATDNGVGFKNGQGQSVVTPTLMKGNRVINSGWRWVVDGEIKATSPTYIVKAADINQTMVLTIAAWVDNREVASEQVTFINTIDGTAGRGIDSVDTYYLLTGMSAGVTRSVAGWTQIVQIPTSEQRFVWVYRVEKYSDGTSSTGEPHILSVYGEKGDKGALDEEQLNDLQDKISSKADNDLTQEQLNALFENQSLIQAELEAKASADTLDNWAKAYQDFVEANDTAIAQAENNLIVASQRVAKLENNLADMSERWNFIDTYMSSSNEGLVIGKNDGSSSMLFSPNGRISMFSAGTEVMYISQGVIHIENGIFSKTIQIGRFREEQYHLNADMNVIRYVGG